MKILHICASWAETNGAAVLARHLAREQEQSGDEVRFATWAGVRALRSADVVYIHCGWLPVTWWAALFARRFVRMPEACYDPVRLAYHGWKKRLAGPVERFFLRRAQSVIATCAAEEAWIRAYEPRVKAVVREDMRRFYRLDVPPSLRHGGALRVLYLGRNHPLKGLDVLRRAVRSIGPSVELQIVSDALGEAKEAAFDWCDVLVLPTLSENFGIVVAEALAHGKLAVTTDGAPAWVNERNERLIVLTGFRDGTDEERERHLRLCLMRLAE